MSENNDSNFEKMKLLFISQKPYLLRALYDWALAHNGRPHINFEPTWPGVSGLPANHAASPFLVLNLAPEACNDLLIRDDGISVKVRFNTVMHDLWIPMGAVRSIYSPDIMNMGTDFNVMQEERPAEPPKPSETPEPTTPKERPSFLKVVK